MAEVDVVIINYRSIGHTAGALRSVHQAAAQDRVSVQPIVINNGDDPAALDEAIADAGGAAVGHNEENLGFGAACNQGVAMGSAPYILFLNPDAALEPGALRGCRDFLADPAHRHIAIVGPELVDAQAAPVLSCSPLPQPHHLLLRTLGLHLILGDRAGYPYLPRASHARSGPVGQVMGAAMMISRATFTELGGFDPAYFLYYEDVDLAARAAACGLGSYYLKDARARHLGAGSSSQASGMALALHIASRLTYMRRHFGALWQVLLFLAIIFVELPARILRSLAGGQDIGVVLNAYRWLLLGHGNGHTIAARAARER